MTYNLLHGDCLELMKTIPDGSVDMCLTDPPYGTTACKWDSVIPFAPMWEQLKRIVKPNGCIALFGSEPFSSALRLSNIKMFRYDWYWEKDKGSNFLFGNRQPMKVIEIVSVFYKKQPQYNPQKTINPKGPSRRFLSNPKSMGNTTRSKEIMPNMPPMPVKGKTYEADKLLPKNIQYFARDQRGRVHPTQKPVPLLEYLIRTYTQPGQTILDFTMGSGSTGVACVNLDRSFIGIEKDDTYFAIAQKRIAEAQENKVGMLL